MPTTAGRDVLLLKEACRCAAELSTDPQTQNGAVLMTVMGELVLAANTFPAITTKAERLVRPLKYSYIEHAERNVIYSAARRGISTDHATLYCPWFACTDCARAIIQAGIKRVVGHQTPRDLSPERWHESMRIADEMLAEADIKITLLDAKLDVAFLFDGNLLEL